MNKNQQQLPVFWVLKQWDDRDLNPTEATTIAGENRTHIGHTKQYDVGWTKCYLYSLHSHVRRRKFPNLLQGSVAIFLPCLNLLKKVKVMVWCKCWWLKEKRSTLNKKRSLLLLKYFRRSTSKVYHQTRIKPGDEWKTALIPVNVCMSGLSCNLAFRMHQAHS